MSSRQNFGCASIKSPHGGSKVKEKIRISGFADEISSSFDEQLQTVRQLGMQYICLRTADGKSIADYSVEEAREKLLTRLEVAGIGVSSLGSPIGKLRVDDEAGFQRQLVQLDTLCQICRLLNCRYIRVFSFYIPEGAQPERYRDAVLEKLKQMLQVAERYQVTLLCENEKELYGDMGIRCLELMEHLKHPLFRLAFDFANFVQCGEDTEACWDMLHAYVSYIHIKDAVSAEKENVLCGTGEGKIALLLRRAIRDEGYDGFLTLEPHLVLFDSLASLELKAPESVIKTNKASSGAEAYAMQYHALQAILEAI